jgi:AmmeMemoRadiSam system protein A
MSHPAHNSLSDSEVSSTAVGGKETLQQEFTSAERNELLGVAHNSISSAFEGRALDLGPPSPHMAEPRGVFTSLYVAGDLRGCVGYVLPTTSVYHAVAETARAAAFDDSRFLPLTEAEMPLLEIQLSILSPPQAIEPEAIEIGHHGLLISLQGRRGLLLPQVAIEHQWDRKTFLEQTCMKAGLPADAWQKGASIQAFSAEIFGDKAF